MEQGRVSRIRVTIADYRWVLAWALVIAIAVTALLVVILQIIRALK